MSKISLNTGWNLIYESLNFGPDKSTDILQRKEGWLETDLPCDIHMPLLRAGAIKEPLEEANSFDCEWIEDKSWWFKKTFTLDNHLLNSDVLRLSLESLDSESDIFLNGKNLGHHKSAFYPFVCDIKGAAIEGENILLVRLSSGVEYVSDFDLAGLKSTVGDESGRGKGRRGDKRRVFVRKPQYGYGWDWGPRVATCGIMKGVFIEGFYKLNINSVHTWTRCIHKNAVVNIDIEINNLHPFSTRDALLKIEFLFENEKVLEFNREVFLTSGKNYISQEAVIESPKLWWPSNMGEQPLYEVRVSVSTEEVVTTYPVIKFGIRTINVNMEKLNTKERKFAFVVNGVEIFCKGGNWIPADSIYARVTDEKYDVLLREAKEANFNMLRIWGGGIYERDIFYEKCDEYGILLWHDFMFACAMYPDNLPWFLLEVEREINYQTKRLRNHASLALWCGNNENHWGFDEWWKDIETSPKYGGEICYNQIAPEIIQRNCPQITYWNSSPYGGENPNGNLAGDRHHWGDCTMNEDMEKRISPEEYDKIDAKFISEYGYIGPCSKTSIEKYHGGKELDRNGLIWQLHNNTFEKDTVAAGIKKHYIDPEKLDINGYLLYAGLCQGLMYSYSLEAIRFKENCGGSLFWMYNDCWGEVGWTIIDYYLKRKISYYFVKRAFAPVKLIMREKGGIVKVMGINETTNLMKFDLEYGYISYDGSSKESSITTAELRPNSRKVLFEFKKGCHDEANGIYFVRAKDDDKLKPAVLNNGNFKKLNIRQNEIEVLDYICDKSVVKFKVSSKAYVHAVHFKLDAAVNLSDEYFDLLPGETREITINNAPEGLSIKDIIPNCVTVL